MVKTGIIRFSAASVAKGSVVISKVVEKNFAREAKASQQLHHFSVLLKRFNSVTQERDIFTVKVRTIFEDAGRKRKLIGDLVSEE